LSTGRLSIRSADILTPTARRGDATGQHTLDLARALRKAQVQVAICCDGVPGSMPEDLHAVTSQVHAGAYHNQSDLVIVQYPSWYSLADRLRGLNSAALFWYHGVTPPDLWGTSIDRALLKISEHNTDLAWHAHLAIAASPFTADELHRHSGYPRQCIRVVPLSIDVAAFAQRPAERILADLRKRWGVTAKRVLLYIGRIAGNKRIDLVIDALARLANDFPDLHLLIVGDAASSNAARELASRLRHQVALANLEGRVTFTGRVEEQQPYYHIAELLILPSQHEGFGAPLVEAMAAGAPVIASTNGAMPWVLHGEQEEQPAGLLFHSGDGADLARQLRRLLVDQELRQTLVARGRARAQEFTPQQFGRRVAAVLAEVSELATMPPPSAQRRQSPLHTFADIALREYRVHSRLPLVGRWIERLRGASTSHLKDAYLDRIVEQQVYYNRVVADELGTLHEELLRLQSEIEKLSASKAP
jgi:glycosyltransferase involved in cell wall biosynthesis